jgi:hypothetical protein
LRQSVTVLERNVAEVFGESTTAVGAGAEILSYQLGHLNDGEQFMPPEGVDFGQHREGGVPYNADMEEVECSSHHNVRKGDIG